MTRQKYLQLIHIATHNLKVDGTTYRQMLHRLTGKTSAKALNIAQTGSGVKRAESQRLSYPTPSGQYKKAD
ncbi:hypothetical protein [Sodalis sp. (in: enterobacteria)]|uniref:hypothetical protein n=1 Tax=Sodalis sp. (in: enterobacteria) TaxID=1898979 RepID=UPI003F6851FD